MLSREDTYLHKGKRKQLIDLLRKKGFTNEKVLSAMERVPRHLFLDSAFINQAYDDVAFPIGQGQTISHPATVACQTDLLQINKGDKILEIGTGSGYQTAVLIEMGAKVFSIERQLKLYEKTKVTLREIGYSAKLYYGDGYKGLPLFSPFDKIIVTAGAPYVPKDLMLQLKENGGIMVIPVGEGSEQTMKFITRGLGNDFESKDLGKFKFVPLLQNKV